jgi:APA family basic amino acid/polyamine antiporter
VSLFTRKTIAQLQAEAEHGALRRALGPLSLTALGIGSVIGTGIFVLTGTAASQHAGPALVLSMIIAGVGCAFAGLCYAEIASMIPVAGSAYTYAYATSGQLVAWIIGWDLVLEYALATATVAVGWSGYFASLMSDLGLPIPIPLTVPPGMTVAGPDGAVVQGLFNLPAAVIVLAVAGLLILGIRQSASANTVLVAIKAGVLVLFVVLCWSYVRRENLTPFIPPNEGSFGQFGWSGVLRGAGVIFFAYIGFDAVSTAAQEARRPQRDLPIGMLASLVICTVVYVAVAFVLIGIVPYRQLNVPDPLAVGIDATGLRWFAPVLKVSALFGLFSTMLVQLLGQTRIFYAMGRDRLLPPMFSAVHSRFRTPHLSTALTAVVVSLAAGLVPIGVLGQLVSMGTLLAFVLVCLGVLILRRTAGDLPRPFRTPLVPWVPLAGALICFAQMASLPWRTWERLFIWLGLGLVVYVGYGRRQAEVETPERGLASGAGSREPGARRSEM